MFSTMGTGLRIDADDIIPSCGLFLTYRGEKYVQHYTIFYSGQYFLVWLLKEKIPFIWWWPSVQGVKTSLYSGSMLKIDCPIAHKILASPLLPSLPPFQPHTCDIVLLRENDTACQMSSLSDTMHILALCMFSSTVEL